MMGHLNLRQSTSEALNETTAALARTEVVEATLLFGSQARGTATAASDIDVIYLLRSERSAHHALYMRTTVNGIDLDVNLVSASDVSRLIACPSWQYRFIDARVVSVKDERRSQATAWLERIQRWMESSLARAQRIWFLRDRVLRLMARAEEAGPRSSGARAFCHALALERGLFIMCELAGATPFADSNPLETLGRHASLDFAHGEWPLVPGRICIDETMRSECWKNLKAFLHCSMMAVPGFTDAASDGRDSADVALELPMTHLMNRALDRLGKDHGWSEASVRRIISEVLTQVPVAETTRESNLALWRVIDRVPIAGERSQGQRHEEYDPARRRLKVIVPTGGCRLPRCTFCRLPELARESNQIEWTTVFSKRDESLEEVAIYTDGSFFDDRELGDADRLCVADCLRSLKVPNVVVESLPQLATFDKVGRFVDRLNGCTRLRISVGIQTLDHVVRQVILGTPTTEAAIEKFFDVRTRLGFAVRVFLLYGKPLLTLAEDENDVRRSVHELSNKLGEQDAITINYLNVVRGTQVGLLEQAGLYQPRDLCRFRMFVQRLTNDGHKFRIAPGCVVVRTCSEHNLMHGYKCANCMEWLTEAEKDKNTEGRKCLRSRKFEFELPWGIFGDAQHRCQFVSHALHSEEFSGLHLNGAHKVLPLQEMSRNFERRDQS